MPKSTVTVDSSHNFAYPPKLDIIKANGLVTVDINNNFVYPEKSDIIEANGLITETNIKDNINALILPKLTFECTDEEHNKYQVELTVSIIESVDGTLIPQVELGEPIRVQK